jgi:hypothetical protein
MIVPRDPWEPITDEMRAKISALWPRHERLDLAWRLALDVDTCEALLLGDPVHPDRLDQHELERARRRRLVRLDFREIDLLDTENLR